MTENAGTTSTTAHEAFREPVEQVLSQWREPSPGFDFRLGWSGDYDHLFLEQFADTTGIEGVLRNARESGRVIIAARGGAGKTTVLYRLMKLALAADPLTVPVVLDLNRWKAPLYDQWKDLPENWVARTNLLLGAISPAMASVAMLEAAGARSLRILFVDGINEVSSGIAVDILAALDELVSRAPQTCVVVTDRLVRRTLRHNDRWRLGTVLPLDDEQVENLITNRFGSGQNWKASSEAERTMLKIPFFLDQLLHSGQPGRSRVSAFEKFFATHALKEAELDKAAHAAFSVYVNDGARTFRLVEFQAVAGPEITSRLMEAGVLRISNGTAYFGHHLQHDYFASRHLARHPEQWKPAVFDRMTFNASSFDVLALCLEQLHSPEQADHFLTLTYDWNLYGTGYALADVYEPGKVSPEMETVVAAMLADRKWDIILATAERARDALALFPDGSLARKFLVIPEKQELYAEIAGTQSLKAWFAEWRAAFRVEEGRTLSDAEVERILDEHSIIGWTTSNVLRRVRLSDDQQSRLRDWGANGTSTVAWRIAHVFGTHPSAENRDFLLGLLTRGEFWVQYGAIRSLIQMAAHANAKLRKSIFEQVRNLIPSLSRGVIDELERAIFIDPARAPGDWSEHATGIIRALFLHTGSEDRERWNNDTARIQSMYRTARSEL